MKYNDKEVILNDETHVKFLMLDDSYIDFIINDDKVGSVIKITNSNFKDKDYFELNGYKIKKSEVYKIILNHNENVMVVNEKKF